MTTDPKSLKPHQTALVLAGIASLVAYFVPGVRLVMLPLQYLNTHFHELCHALVGTATGGRAQYIIVRSDGSGLTWVGGGGTALTVAAGYIGATLIGGGIIYAARSPERAKTVLRVLAVILGIAMLIWVRGDSVGILSGVFWVLALWFGAKWLNGKAALFAAQFIGLQQCLNAVNSMVDLLFFSVHGGAETDASIMQGYTSIPAVVWAVLWCGFSLVALYITLRKAWHTPVDAKGPTANGVV